MKRVFASLVLVLVCACSAWATDITISSHTKQGYQYTDAAPKIRIYVSMAFLSSTGEAVPASAVGSANWYRIINCTANLTTHVLSIPSFTLPATFDGNPNTSRYTFVLFTGSTKRETLYSNMKMPTSYGTTITAAQWITDNTTAPSPPRPGFPDTQQVQTLINAVLPAPLASDVITGKSKLSVAAADSLNPIARGVNDTTSALGGPLTDFGGQVFNVKAYGAVCNGSTSDTTAIAAANTAAVAGGGAIYLPPSTGGCKVGTTTISAPVVSDGGSFLLTTGLTTTITGLISAPPRILFRNATTGQGTVSVSGGTVYTEWWGAVGDNSTACLPAINAALASGGKVIRMLAGTYRVAATGINGASGVTWRGEGIGVTTIKLMAAPSVDMVIFQSKSYFHVRDITFDYNSQVPVGSVAAIAVQNGSAFDVSDSEIINMGTFGIAVNGGSDFRILRNRISKGTAVSAQNQCLVISTSAGAVEDGWVQDNICTKSGMDVSAKHLVITGNRIRDFKFGGGVTTEQDVNTYENIIASNIITGGVGTDANAYNVGGIENWGHSTVISNNITEGNSGSGIDQGGRYSAVNGNITNNNGTTGGSGIVARYGDGTYNSLQSVYTGNVARGASQVYGFQVQNNSVSYQFVFGNMFLDNGTSPVNVPSGTAVMSFLGPSLEFSSTWNPANILTGGAASVNFVAAGAQVSDQVTVSFSNSLSALTLTGYVDSTNSVTVVLANNTAGAVDLASGTLRVKVLKNADGANF